MLPFIYCRIYVLTRNLKYAYSNLIWAATIVLSVKLFEYLSTMLLGLAIFDFCLLIKYKGKRSPEENFLYSSDRLHR